jgi:hypothetical protein
MSVVLVWLGYQICGVVFDAAVYESLLQLVAEISHGTFRKHKSFLDCTPQDEPDKVPPPR